jgi:hypothetical protein
MRPMCTSKGVTRMTSDAIVLCQVSKPPLHFPKCQELISTVFLRALDYFQGILFLTTNRVGSFDEAFMSRIHVQIGYDPLDDDARNKIWDNNFRKLKEDHEAGEREIRYEWEAKEYIKQAKEVRDLSWNGREIRNGKFTLKIRAFFLFYRMR